MYQDVTFKFVQHFIWISYAMDRIGYCHDEMWDDQDGFFYDVLRLPAGRALRLRMRSMVGLLPLSASTLFEVNAGAISEVCPIDRAVQKTPEAKKSIGMLHFAAVWVILRIGDSAEPLDLCRTAPKSINFNSRLSCRALVRLLLFLRVKLTREIYDQHQAGLGRAVIRIASSGGRNGRILNLLDLGSPQELREMV